MTLTSVKHLLNSLSEMLSLAITMKTDDHDFLSCDFYTSNGEFVRNFTTYCVSRIEIKDLVLLKFSLEALLNRKRLCISNHDDLYKCGEYIVKGFVSGMSDNTYREDVKRVLNSIYGKNLCGRRINYSFTDESGIGGLCGADFGGDTLSVIKEEGISMMSAIKNVIFNNPATIVFWNDGTKTVVKANNDDYDPEKGLAMAIAKKALGNKGSYYNEIKKWVNSDKNPEFVKKANDAILRQMAKNCECHEGDELINIHSIEEFKKRMENIITRKYV